MKRQQRTIGAVIAIPLPNGYRAYGRILKNASFAFYDFVSPGKSAAVEQVIQSKVLFIVAAYDRIIHRGQWLKIHQAAVEAELEDLPKKYMEDILAPGHYSLYDANTGEITPASKQECQGLEQAAVWEGWEVEKRLMNHFFPGSPPSE